MSPDGSLQHLIAVVRRRWVTLAIVVGVCVVGGVVLGLASGSSYEASARVLFNARSLPEAALQVDRQTDEPERDAGTNALVASSRAVAERVGRRLGASADSMLDAVRAQPEQNANVLEIRASDGSAERAAAIANAFAEEFVAFRAQGDRRALRAAQADLQRQLEALPPDAVRRTALRDTQGRLAALEAVADGGARVIGRATPPGSSSSLGALRAAAIGLILGAALALALAFLLEALDRRARTVESLERAYGVRALAVVPRGGDDLEPLRIVRNALEVAGVAERAAVLITGAGADEGRTTVAVDLARAIALTGRRAVLAELDLRSPAVGKRFELHGDGAVAALRGRGSAPDLLREPLPGLWVLAAGSAAPDAAELLESPALDSVLGELKADDATVVIDAPPLVGVADAQALLRPQRVDAVLVVARLGATALDDVAGARAILDRHGVEPLGLIVVDDRPARPGEAGPEAGRVGPAYEAPAETVR